MALWRIDMRCVQSSLVGDLPDLPAHTPMGNATNATPASVPDTARTPMHIGARVGSGVGTPMSMATSMSMSMCASPAPGWASAMKRWLLEQALLILPTLTTAPQFMLIQVC